MVIVIVIVKTITGNRKHRRATAKPAACANSLAMSILPTFFYILGALVKMLPYWSRPNSPSDSTHMVYADTPNFIWMCSLYRLPVAKNHILGQILTFRDSCLYRLPFTDEGQIWCARAHCQSSLEISCKSVRKFLPDKQTTTIIYPPWRR